MASTRENGGHDPGIAQISEEFLAKYNRPGPRYTSYPTAPVWKEDLGPGDLERVFAQADQEGRPVSLYTHIPFCESLCLFCACTVSIQKNKSVAIPYLDSVKREVEHVGRFVSRKRPVIQFHWGGGTPTYLTPVQIEDLFGYTREHFNFAANCEIGIEVDPRVTTLEHLETLRKLGFNRLSMGVQDFEPRVQETIHRIQPYEMTRDLIVAARWLGFDSINVDLIYGLPYQTAESFHTTIEKVLTLSPDRVAMFSYAHVPWLKKQQGSFATHLPEGMEKFRIFRAGLEGFLSAGYLYIGMDHFARPTDELALAQQNRTLHRNFQGYTTKAGADLYGLGVSAISAVGSTYSQNSREVPAYQAGVARRGIATMRGYRLTEDDRIRRSVISRLLCHTVIPKRAIEAEFGIAFDEYFAPELERLGPFRADGLVVTTADEIRVTMLGRIFIRNVGMIFDRYLTEQRMDSRPLFSKTL
ncbi:MAG: oxygen-independent coproporphyrinogen III oxidase [Candidatus Acidiferrales bacterium]